MAALPGPVSGGPLRVVGGLVTAHGSGVITVELDNGDGTPVIVTAVTIPGRAVPGVNSTAYLLTGPHGFLVL